MTGINQRGRYGQYIQLILTAVDFLIINIAFFITAWLTPAFIEERTRSVWLIANIAYLPAAYLLSHTQTSRTIGMEHVIANSLRSVAMHAPIFICALYFLQIDSIPWQAFVEFYGIMFVLFPLWWSLSRTIIKYFRRRGRNFAKIIIVGSNSTSNKFYQTITSDIGFGYHILGVFDDEKHPDTPDDIFRGTIDDMQAYVEENPVDEIFCALPGSNTEGILKSLKLAEHIVAQFYYIPQINRYMSHNYDMYAIGTIPVMSMRHQPLTHLRNRICKRAFDLLVSGTFLLFSPLIFIPVGIAIKLSSPGPVFFRQKRTGYRGREFYCYKFRTMKVNADADTQQATKDDPRKTRIGDILRKTSIDELPQFFNVFIGNMSVVGPRPHMLRHTEDYSRLINKYMVRHYIKPGITGWAQINGYRGQTDELWMMEKRVEHDVWYIEHWSTMLDIKIIFRTVYNAIHGEQNAY
ncbi:MAG: undecaprenyl-phosphate glucose phosphotransferase [Bacteroides sp.]|nr:undecaprenyl-phosphate glucose phosphotransferase [Bacteroides sp.]MCM1414065.1 undecaprenyl-phosphate glucose phosphotransferase [Bacteroides sp.]MCM1472336.1 undecaprenyl-phosphate glucose phosphotransferase [Bacteroides sp.]